MAASLTTLQFPSSYLQTHNTPTTKFKLKSTPIPKLNGFSRIKCSYSNGRKPDSGDEMTREERRRAELSARIASGEFTVEKPSLGSLLVSSLAKLGVPSDFLEPLANLMNSGESYPKIPEAKGAISAIRSEAFFIPLYELYLTYGGIFRLTFGPKSFLIVSDPNIAKHILRDNAKAYSKGILAEILEFVMGTGLIPADGEVWQKHYILRMVVEEDVQFNEEYMNESDPSILHFLLASGDNVSSKQLRDDLMTMLIAGHETTAAVLTWTFYLLSKEPDIMSKLQNEVDAVLGDRFPTMEEMKKLKYTTRVINESLRLYPQPPVLIRRSIEEDVLEKYPIKRGEDLFISIWNLHRSLTHWVDADKFNPERWPLDGPNPNETNQNFSYLPFGGGPRKCVGDMFASFEAIVAVSMLVRRFNFQMALGAPPVKMTTGATIHTTEGLNMTVTRRMKPPIVPTLETQNLGNKESSVNIPEADPVVTLKKMMFL